MNGDANGILAKRDPTGNAAMTLHDLVPGCLIANSGKLAYIFTTLNLTPTGDASWLAPKNSNYVYVQGTGKGPGYLAIFSMVSDTDVSKNQLKIDPSLSNGNTDTSMAIAGHIFLEHVVKPKLPASYIGANDRFFQMSGNSITSVVPLQCKPVKWGLINYHPMLLSLSVSISASELVHQGQRHFRSDRAYRLLGHVQRAATDHNEFRQVVRKVQPETQGRSGY